ncbi:AI-2E family transporter [Paradesertivirga mongoliensis]|uniref:AI-2E family transporter n=1 Tax=Paradesertivirga mongoliensis TaxID=2100740 RepID=A0ABW4ZHQ8_9SPHI|nr:AI-2E family transporter [Pedobacter mongoliensis]
MAFFNYKQRNNIVLIILIILGGGILYSLRYIAGTLLSTVVMYTIFRPVYLHINQKWQWRKAAASISVIIISFIIIILPIITLCLMVMHKVNEFRQDPLRVQYLVKRLDAFFYKTFNQRNLVDNALDRASGYASDLFPSILGGAGSLLLGISVMYFLLYFMFRHYQKFEAGLIRFSPFREQNALKFADEMKNTTYSNVLGQGLIATVQGALVSLGFFIFDIPDALFWGVISTFLSFLPLIGAALVFVPAGILALANGDETAGWGILIWGFVLVTNIDNVIRFLIAKRVGNIHPIITIIGVVVGIPAFGIMGLVYGPLLLSYFILTVRIYETSKLATERLEQIRSAEEE